VISRIDLNPLRAFDAKHEPTQRVMAKAPRLIDRLPQEDLDHFAEVQDLLRAADLTYTVDTTLVRGLDYYTRTLFEFQSGALEAAQNTLGGGGRYDGLAEAIGGPPTPGMGWAAGVERMIMASTQPPPVEPPVDLYVAYEPTRKPDAFRLAADARRAGLSARLELAGRSLKGQLKQASRSGARYVAIFGPEGVQLRDREGGDDKLVDPGTVMHHIRGRLGDHHARTSTATPGPASSTPPAWGSRSAWRAGCIAAATTAAWSSSTCATARASSSSSSTPRRPPKPTRSPSGCVPSTS
jgi:histidyl-tRNA synthetase